MSQVLVTGGAGFIGARVVAAMVAAGHRVRVLDLVAPPDPPEGVDVVLGDVRDAGTCRAAAAGVDVVSHQAATVGMGLDLQDLPRYAGTNDLGTAVLLAAMHAQGVRRMLLASSMVVYGEGAYCCDRDGPSVPGDRREEDLAAGRFDPACPVCGERLEPALVAEDAPLDPRSVYAATKVAQEHLVGAWARAGAGTAALLRYHNVYGPGLPRDTPYAGVAAIFRSDLLGGRAPQVFEDGAQRRDLVHVDDVAAANVAALGVRPEHRLRAYNVASGTVSTILELARGLHRALGGPLPRVTGRYRAGDVRHVTADPGRARRELSWRARVDPSQGIRELATAGLTTASPADAGAPTR